MSVCKYYQEHGRIRSGDLQRARDEELAELKFLVDEDIARIDAQLVEAKSKAFTERVFANPAWFRDATLAKRLKGQLSQKLQLELGKRKKERAALNRQIHNDAFVRSLLRAMDEVLPSEQKAVVLETAKRLMVKEGA